MTLIQENEVCIIYINELTILKLSGFFHANIVLVKVLKLI